MAFRNFDNHDRYYTIDGNPLQGCLEFMVKGGNTKANIYDRNRVPLANPQLTDLLGRTDEQVFVDSDVVAYVYKYIGEGRFGEIEENSIDTTDQSMWALQYTVESAMDAETVVNTSSAPAVMTMAELRSLDVAEVPNTDGVKVIALHGYYEAGDKSVVWYVWHGDATVADDNGSVIKSDHYQSGRWILVQPELVCDSRHFGVFPQESAGEFVDHTTGITQLVEYCNAKGLKPIFNGSVSKPYFIYNFLTVSSRNPIVVSRGTIFVDKQHARFYGEWEGDPRFQNGLTKVSCSVIKASWNFEDAITYQTVYLDDTCQMASFRDATVYVTVDTAGKSFDHCDIVSDGHLANNSFSDCVLRGSMFTSESLAPVIDDQCTIQPLDFTDRMDLWCTLRSQQHDPVVDVCMQTLDSHCDLALDGIFIKNALFDNFVHDATVSLGLESCRGSITINALGNYALTVEDSELVLTMNNTGEIGTGMQPSVISRNSTLDFVNQLTYLVALGSTTTSFTGNGILVNGDIALDSCNVAIPMTLRGMYTARHSTIASNVLHYTVNQIAQVEMVHNTLKAYYTLQPAVANTTVRGVWANNTSTVHSPIVLDRTNLDPIDSHHDYVYAGNTGGFLPYRTKREIHEFTIHHVSWAAQWLTDPYTLIQTTLGNTASSGEYCWFGKMIPHYDMQHHFDTVEMFRLGIDRFRINAKLTDIGSTLLNSGSDYEYSMNVPVEAGLGGYFVSGNTFCIRPWFDDPTAEQENLSYTGVSPVIMKGSRSFGGSESPTFTDYHVYMGIEYECMDRHEQK